MVAQRNASINIKDLVKNDQDITKVLERDANLDKEREAMNRKEMKEEHINIFKDEDQVNAAKEENNTILAQVEKGVAAKAVKKRKAN